jgi:hypothetical protein
MTGAINIPSIYLYKSNRFDKFKSNNFKLINPTIYYFPIKIHFIRLQSQTKNFEARLPSFLLIYLSQPFTGHGAIEDIMKYKDKRIHNGIVRLMNKGNI